MTTGTKSKARKCPECGGPLSQRSLKQTIMVGASKVNDNGRLRVPTCAACGYYELTQKQLSESELGAALVVFCDAQNIDGGALKYARKALRLTQADLARELGVEPETVSRWETGKMPVTRMAQVAIAGLLKGDKPNTVETLEPAPISRTG
ncbi:MAG: helix-turn-helix domain-containing protein [Polyangiaceae bacterium]|nr:helix-turn-helix domain-containing protein [Polyangiaceae bacterium]